MDVEHIQEPMEAYRLVNGNLSNDSGSDFTDDVSVLEHSLMTSHNYLLDSQTHYPHLFSETALTNAVRWGLALCITMGSEYQTFKVF